MNNCKLELAHLEYKIEKKLEVDTNGEVEYYKNIIKELQVKIDRMTLSLEGLTDRERNVIELCYMNIPVLKYFQVAEIIGISNTSVFQIRQRSFQKIEYLFNQSI